MTRKTRPVSWIKAALKEFETFPEGARSICLAALTIAAEGGNGRYGEADAWAGVGGVRDCPAFRGDAMTDQPLEVVRGSGNVFRDLGDDNADVAQLKAILAAEIIKVLDRERLSVRAAQSRTRIAAADFSRIRNADLGRFTVDRLISIINRLGSRVELKVRVRRATR